MINQTRILKDLLKRNEITDNNGNLHVKTLRKSYSGGKHAVAHCRYLTTKERNKIKKQNPKVKIFNFKQNDEQFSIIEY